MTRLNLNDYLDAPGDLLLCSRCDVEAFSRSEVEAFQLEAARRKLKRQAERIPVIGDMLGSSDPSTFERFDDFIPHLFDEYSYKSYDSSWIESKAFGRLTHWMDRFTAADLSGVDMEGCASLTEWCRRIGEQADNLVCHSSGTSGILSFVLCSQRDRDLYVDGLLWSCQPYAPDSHLLFHPHQRNDVTHFALHPRRQFRLTQAIYDGLEQRYQMNPVQALCDFLSPEFAIAQGKLRNAAADGTMEACLKNPIVAAYRDEVERFQRDMPAMISRWTSNLIENFRGKRIFFQGSFGSAWQLTQEFKKVGAANAFSPDSIFSLVGGIKDGSKLPDDWQDQFRRATGVDECNFVFSWGMTEINGAVRRCPGGMYHFRIQCIPYLLEPRTRKLLPRKGVQTGQFAMLELVSEDSWGGMISGDRGTMHWDRVCTCGRDGPLLEADSVTRL